MTKKTVCDGNHAAAWGACLAQPDMVAVYPITPQSSLGEHLSVVMSVNHQSYVQASF